MEPDYETKKKKKKEKGKGMMLNGSKIEVTLLDGYFESPFEEAIY